MVEKFHGSHEKSAQTPEVSPEQHEAHRRIIEKGRHARHEHADKIEEIRAKAEHEAEAAHKTTENYQQSERPETDQPMLVNRELKQMAYRRTLKRTQNRLPKPARPFSRFVHQPAVENISEIAAATVARPSGVLAGGIASLLGTSAFLWIARHYGYEFNFLLFATLFVGGFMIGLLIELAVRLLSRNKR